MGVDDVETLPSQEIFDFIVEPNGARYPGYGAAKWYRHRPSQWHKLAVVWCSPRGGVGGQDGNVMAHVGELLCKL